MGGNGPAMLAFLAGKILEKGAPEATAVPQKRDGLDEVRLAGAIGTGERHETRSRIEPQRRVVAEIREYQPSQDEGGGHDASLPSRRAGGQGVVPHTRIGIST